MQITPYRLTLVALRLMAVWFFFDPVIRLITAIYLWCVSLLFSRSEWPNPGFSPHYDLLGTFIIFALLAWLVWRVSPWLARLIVAPLNAETLDADGNRIPRKPTAGELEWEERQREMRAAPKKPPQGGAGDKDWMAT